jgi:hypothetical protein
MKKELYHRFSVQQFPQLGESTDQIHSEEINRAISKWLAKNPNVEGYRIINANTFQDSKTSLPRGIQSAYTEVHIAYWI